MIGSKTLVTLLSALAAVLLALGSGALSPHRLATHGADALLLAGIFGVLVGVLMFRFWRLGETSATYFRVARDGTLFENEGHFLGGPLTRLAVGKNEGGAFDLGPRSQLMLCVALALVTGLASIDTRALELLGRFTRNVAVNTTSFCPEVEAKPAADDPNAPGCALVRRAFALGYAKDLGDCGVSKTRAAAAAVCTLRQRDEPFAHYAWRLLGHFGAEAEQYFEAGYFGGLKSDFEKRVSRLDSINTAQREVLSSAPHSSHHVWVSLPDPGGSSLFGSGCEDRYRYLPHRPAPGDPAKAGAQVFEHVLAQLLFESRYEPAAAYCREVVIHWGAPPDACRQLAKSPEGFLAQSGALPHVRAVLDRWRLGKDLEQLGKQRSSRELPPQAFVSFSCWVEKARRPPGSGDATASQRASDPAPPGRRAPQEMAERWSAPVKLDGLELTAEELTVAPLASDAPLFVERYDEIATLLTRGFHYGALLSEAGLEGSGSEGLEPSFSKNDFEMSRLFGLEAVDIYLDPGWMAHRADLLEVYPYQLHLKNYVKVFRGQYRRERGRL